MKTGLNLQQQVARDDEHLRRVLGEWLRARPGWDGARLGDVHRSGSGGSANESIVLYVDGAPAERIVLRVKVPAVEPFLDTDVERQAKVLEWVAGHTTVPVPTVIGVEPSDALLGGAFMVMEFVDGVAAPDYPGYNIEGFIRDGTVEFRRALWEGALDEMCRLHTADATSIDFLGEPGLPGLLGYWRRVVEWVGERCDVQPLDTGLTVLERNMASDAPTGLSWGDARIANMLFVGPRCTAVLDWEIASLGGPLVDLAWWLMFDLIQSVDIGVPRLDGLGSRAETIERWEAQTGGSTASLAWHDALAHVQLALTRANVFARRAALGLPVPAPDDPRSVERLVARLDSVLTTV